MATSITAQVLTHLLQKEIHWTTRIFGFPWKVKRSFLPAFIFSPCSLSTVLNFSPETKGSVFHTTLLASFSILNKGLILCRCDNSYEWSAMCPRYAIIFERGSRITNVARNAGWFMNVGTKKGPKTEELGTEFLKIVSNRRHVRGCERGHANSLHVICLFSSLSGFTFHTLGSLCVLGTRDLKWLRAERNLREIQLALLYFAFRATVALWLCGAEKRMRGRRGRIGRCWEREKRRWWWWRGARDRKSRQPWFAVTPPQASCAIFNTQAHVLSNLSCPPFNIKRHSVTVILH